MRLLPRRLAHGEEATVVEHLGELRSRIVFCLITSGGLAPATWPQSPAVMNIQGLGKGTTELSGRWQFHLGNAMRWAQPGIEDVSGQEGWETIRPDEPW